MFFKLPCTVDVVEVTVIQYSLSLCSSVCLQEVISVEEEVGKPQARNCVAVNGDPGSPAGTNGARRKGKLALLLVQYL